MYLLYILFYVKKSWSSNHRTLFASARYKREMLQFDQFTVHLHRSSFPCKLTTMILQANPVSELMINVVRHGDLTTLQKLIDLGASTDVSDVSRDPLLFVPIVEGNDEMLASLLTHGLFDFLLFSNFSSIYQT